MRVAIAGGHGQIALRLARQLADRGDDAVSLIRNPQHADEVRQVGATPVECDLEQASADQLAALIQGCDAVVFAAGAGPSSGIARKDSLDRGGAVLLADAAEQAGVRRYLLVSSMGVDRVRGGATPDDVGEVFLAYLRAKLAAEEYVASRDLDWTVVRPGLLTNDTGTGSVALGPDVGRDEVSREDVAAVLVALLDEPRTAELTLALTRGAVPIRDAVAALLT